MDTRRYFMVNFFAGMRPGSLNFVVEEGRHPNVLQLKRTIVTKLKEQGEEPNLTAERVSIMNLQEFTTAEDFMQWTGHKTLAGG